MPKRLADFRSWAARRTRSITIGIERFRKGVHGKAPRRLELVEKQLKKYGGEIKEGRMFLGGRYCWRRVVQCLSKDWREVLCADGVVLISLGPRTDLATALSSHNLVCTDPLYSTCEHIFRLHACFYKA